MGKFKLHDKAYPTDNSYCHELGRSERESNPYLAGTVNTFPQLVEIYGIPFERTFTNFLGNEITRQFVVVKHNGKFYNILNRFKISFDLSDHDGST